MPDDTYANIRELLGSFVGKRLEDVTQHDRDDWEQDGRTFVTLMFEGGDTITFNTGERACTHEAFVISYAEEQEDGD